MTIRCGEAPSRIREKYLEARGMATERTSAVAASKTLRARRLFGGKRTRLGTGCQRPRPPFYSHRCADPGCNITDRPAAIPQEGVGFFSHPGHQFRSLA